MKILIVDDETIVRRALERALVRNKHEVLTAEEGFSGLELWQKEHFDVVILDVLMPGLTGPQVLENKQTWGCRVILMSAYTGEEASDFRSKFKIDLFLPKPFENIFEIVRKIEELSTRHD